MTTQVYLLEKCGPRRSVFGPYGIEAARHEAGNRYALVVGSGLSHGQSMTRGDVQAAIESGRIRTVDRIILT